MTKLGDVYELNNHRLVCGDSTLSEHVELCLNGNKPVLMVTDPPYGVNYDPEWRKGVGSKKLTSLGNVKNDHIIDWSLAWKLFPGDVVYVWHSDRFNSECRKNLEETSFKIISQIIWVKQKFCLSRGNYHCGHEPCWYAVKNGKKHNWQGSRKESTVWKINWFQGFVKPKGEIKTTHPTQKPLECMERPIRNNTSEGQGVYDPFLGSGTTLIAAEKTNRVCYGLELCPDYCDIIVERWKNHMIQNDKSFVINLNGKVIND